MRKGRSSNLLGQVHALFGVGALTGLSDAQLLERFASRSAAAAEDALAAEAAFEALVARHGPMVLGVCRRALDDPRDIEDAFQATFLVLVRRAASVRVGDSLGRWLYGVSRRVAAKARARGQRARLRVSPLADEPPAPAPEPAADQAERLAALDDEVSRLPQRYRAAVILCHFEGLSHAEAAARLRWPVGTVSGRLSRARSLLKDRLLRRGVAPAAGWLSLLLAAEGVRAAVPEPLALSTVRAAVATAMGGAPQAGAASTTALALVNAVLPAAVAFKLKAGATILLACAVAGAAVAGAAGRHVAQTSAADRGSASNPVGSAQLAPVQLAAHRPADQIVKDIEMCLAAAERPSVQEPWLRIHEKIAALVDELRTSHPQDPRIPHYLPERWASLTSLHHRALVRAEIDETLRTTKNPVFKTDVLLFETCLKLLYERVDGRTAVWLAGSFARQSPHDERAGELLCVAEARLEDDWYILTALLALLITAGAGLLWTARPRRTGPRGWLSDFLVRLSGALVVLVLVLVFSFRFLPYKVQHAIGWFLFGWLNWFGDRAFRRTAGFAAGSLLYRLPGHIAAMAWSVRWGIGLALAAATALVLLAGRRYFVKTATRWMPALRLAILGFIAVLTICGAIDALLLARQRAALEDRIVRDHPSLFHERLDAGEHWLRERAARLLEHEQRQRECLGKPFDLEFTDTISGRQVSLKALRGKVVVVNFWATDRGPLWSAAIPEMKQFFTDYHGKGVEFIGVCLNLRDVDGGYESLKSFVASERISWPQFHDVSESERAATRPSAADRLLGQLVRYEGFDSNRVGVVTETAASDFALYWGINEPAVFLIDTEGKLYSTKARGKLDTLIPQLLERLPINKGRKP